VPPRPAGRRHEGHTGRDRRAHGVSRAGAGIWPGPKTATTRRRPAWHTGHRVRSRPVSRSIRAATGFVVSSAERLGCGGRLRRHRGEEGPAARELGRMAPVGEEPEVADPDEAAREDLDNTLQSSSPWAILTL